MANTQMHKREVLICIATYINVTRDPLVLK